jgi:hypothetical protein
MATVGQCLDPPNRSTHCLVVRRAPTAKHGTSTCHPSKHQTRSSHDSLFSPRLAFHERGATPTFIWRPPLLSCLGDVWWRLAVHGSRGRQPVHAFVINRASDRCGMWSQDPRSIISCFMLSCLHLDSGNELNCHAITLASLVSDVSDARCLSPKLTSYDPALESLANYWQRAAGSLRLLPNTNTNIARDTIYRSVLAGIVYEV